MTCGQVERHNDLSLEEHLTVYSKRLCVLATPMLEAGRFLRDPPQ